MVSRGVRPSEPPGAPCSSAFWESSCGLCSASLPCSVRFTSDAVWAGEGLGLLPSLRSPFGRRLPLRSVLFAGAGEARVSSRCCCRLSPSCLFLCSPPTKARVTGGEAQSSEAQGSCRQVCKCRPGTRRTVPRAPRCPVSRAPFLALPGLCRWTQTCCLPVCHPLPSRGSVWVVSSS